MHVTKIRGKLVKADLGEWEGKTYGEILVETDGERVKIQYPRGSEFEVPEVGSIIEVEYSGDLLPKLEAISLIERPVRQPTQTTATEPLQEVSESSSYASGVSRILSRFGITKEPLYWLLMLVMVYLGYQLVNMGYYISGFWFNSSWLNSVRDVFSPLSIGVGLFSIVAGFLLLVNKPRLPKMLSLTLAFLASLVGTLVWSGLANSDLLIGDEIRFANIHAGIGVLCIILAMIIYFTRFRGKQMYS
jgi:hypothetical protein